MMEIERIRKIVNEMSMDEFEDALHDCGIESMKPSIESSYIKCLKRNISEREYRKEVCNYSIQKNYFDVYELDQEVA